MPLKSINQDKRKKKLEKELEPDKTFVKLIYTTKKKFKSLTS